MSSPLDPFPAEAQVIGSVMLQPQTLERCLSMGLSPFDFQTEDLRKAYSAACKLHSAQEGVDLVAASDEAQRAGMPFSLPFLNDILSGWLPHSSIDRHIWSVMDYARRRDAARALIEVQTQVEIGATLDLGDLHHALAAVGTRSVSKIPTIEQAMLEVYNDRLADEQTGGIKTYWPTLDRSIGRCILPGEVVAIAARASVGKTWAALNWIIEALLRLPAHVGALFVSLEMKAAEVWHRIMAIRSDHNVASVYSALLGEQGGPYWDLMTHDPACSRLRVVDPSTLTPRDLRELIDQFQNDTGLRCQVVAVDYLGLLTDGNPRSSDYTRISANVRAMKSIAKAMDTTLLVPVQLRRGDKKSGPGDGSKRPSLDDMRDSGAIEEAMDRIVAAWAPGLDPKISPSERRALEGCVHMAWLKNRHGSLGDRDSVTYFTAGNRMREQQRHLELVGGD